jgi:hypothetical protein
MAVCPQIVCDREWVDFLLLPPTLLRKTSVKIAVMEGAKGNDKFVADLLA